MAKPRDLKPETFEAEVLQAPLPVLVEFWSHTCPHCLRLNPDFDQAAEESAGQVKFVRVAAQECRPLFQQHGVSAVPTLVLFRDGKEAARQSGVRTSAEILSWLEQCLAA